MASSAANPSNRVYDDFEPTFEWAKEDGADTLLLFLPGFRKEQIKVQITSTGNLRVTGERHVGDNRWSRFRMEIPIKPNYETNKITAKYENGILFVKHPKTIVSVPAEPRTEAKPIVESSQPPKATTPAAPKATTPAAPKATTPPAPMATTPAAPKATTPAAPMATTPAAPKATTPPVPKEQKQKEMAEPSKSQETPLKKPEEGEKPKEKTPEIKEAATDMKPRNEGENAGAGADEKKMKDANEADKKKPDVGNFAEANLPQKAETSTARDNTERKRDKKPDGSGDGVRKKEELAPPYPRLSQIPKPTNYKQAIGDFVVNLKKPRNLITTVAAVLLVVVIGLSVKTAIKSFGKPQSSRPENTEL